jgi:hypothetical protein
MAGSTPVEPRELGSISPRIWIQIGPRDLFICSCEFANIRRVALRERSGLSGGADVANTGAAHTRLPFWRRYGRSTAAVGLTAAALWSASLPAVTEEERARRAEAFRFEATPLPQQSPIAHQTIRQVHPSLTRIAAWISSVGASVALTDLDGSGLPDEACHVDPRFDEVRVSAADRADRFASFALPLTALGNYTRAVAPMGCVPGDYDEDGRIDLLVYFWGRTPVIFRQVGDPLQPSAFQAEELVPGPPLRWYTNSATRADLDGDGHADLVIANYFPDGARVLDADASGPSEAMQDSMTRAANGGQKHFFLWNGVATSGAMSRVSFRHVVPQLHDELRHRWTLAVGAADLDGDLLPELYFANDFGPDALLRNESTPGALRFTAISGKRDFRTPTSKILGRDSFKGMGVDFGDVNGDGMPDIYVSNIADEYALLESHFLFLSTNRRLAAGIPTYVDASERLGVSRSSWAWDAKLDDFDNDGVLEAVQATGFIRGTRSRWPELQELATGNDQLVRRPGNWPRFGLDDDLSGWSRPAFFARHRDGRFYDIADLVGLGTPSVSRGIATADINGDGRLDLALANQWDTSAVFTNVSPPSGAFVGLHLGRPLEPRRFEVRAGHPDRRDRTTLAIGASVQLWRRTELLGTREVDGGNGHSGRRSGDLHFGLGPSTGPVHAVIRWRSADGTPRMRSVDLTRGWYTVILGDS